MERNHIYLKLVVKRYETIFQYSHMQAKLWVAHEVENDKWRMDMHLKMDDTGSDTMLKSLTKKFKLLK